MHDNIFNGRCTNKAIIASWPAWSSALNRGCTDSSSTHALLADRCWCTVHFSTINTAPRYSILGFGYHVILLVVVVVLIAVI